MITVKSKKYDRDYPEWVTKCPICNQEELDSIVILTSNIHIQFAIGENCRKELAERLLHPEKES